MIEADSLDESSFRYPGWRIVFACFLVARGSAQLGAKSSSICRVVEVVALLHESGGLHQSVRLRQVTRVPGDLPQRTLVVIDPGHQEAYRGLPLAAHETVQQRRFVEEYLIDLNATQGAARAWYIGKQPRNKPPGC